MSARDFRATWRRFRADLRAKPRQTGALVLLLPVLVAVWTPLLVGGEEALAPSPSTSSASAPAAARVARRAEPDAVERLRPRLARLGAPSRGLPTLSRDPFTRRVEEGPRTTAVAATATATLDAAAAEAELASRCRLGATFLAPGRTAAARIDGRLVRVGEPFGVFALEEVGPRWVSLRGRHGRYRLEMARTGGG